MRGAPIPCTRLYIILNREGKRGEAEGSRRCGPAARDLPAAFAPAQRYFRQQLIFRDLVIQCYGLCRRLPASGLNESTQCKAIACGKQRVISAEAMRGRMDRRKRTWRLIPQIDLPQRWKGGLCDANNIGIDS